MLSLCFDGKIKTGAVKTLHKYSAQKVQVFSRGIQNYASTFFEEDIFDFCEIKQNERMEKGEVERVKKKRETIEQEKRKEVY